MGQSELPALELIPKLTNQSFFDNPRIYLKPLPRHDIKFQKITDAQWDAIRRYLPNSARTGKPCTDYRRRTLDSPVRVHDRHQVDGPSARKVRLKIDGTQEAAGLAEGRRVEEDTCSSSQSSQQQQQQALQTGESTRIIDVMEGNVLKTVAVRDDTSRIRKVHADAGYNRR